MTTTPSKNKYNIIEIAASTAFGSQRDYGSHPVPITQTGEFALPELIAQPFPDYIPPISEFRKWGRWRQDKQSEAWIHYAADVKLSSLLRDPQMLVQSGAKITTEINCSSFSDDPLPVALPTLWRKRCISRCWQDQGIQVAIDLNVEGWTRKLVFEGVPTDHSLFATRFITQKGVKGLIDDFALITDHVQSGTKTLLLVYGGGKQIADLCAEYGWLHLPPINGRR